MPVTRISVALAVAGLALMAAPSAEAGCTRRIINKSNMTAYVRRDGGPAVRIGPHRAQAIHYYRPGEVEVALSCGNGAPAWTIAFTYTAVLDRCYIEIGSGVYEAQLGPGHFYAPDAKPLTLNMPRQGDFVIGPGRGDVCGPAE